MNDSAASAAPSAGALGKSQHGEFPVGARAWYFVGILTAAHVVSYMDRMIMSLLVEPVRATFAISDTQYSLLAGLAFGLFYATMGLPMGRLADRINRRNLIVCALIMWSSMTLLCGVATGFWMLFFARMGLGVGEAALIPASLSMVSDRFPKHVLGRAVSVFYMGATLGSAFAFMVGGAVLLFVETLGQLSIPLLGDVHGWQAVFLVAGVPGMLIAFLMMATLREPPRREGTGRAVLGNAGNTVPLRAVVGYIYARKRAFGAHIISMALWVTAGHGLLMWSPSYLIRAFGFTHAEAGWTFGLIMLTAGTAGLMVGGSLADWLMRRGYSDSFNRVLLAAMVLMIPCYVCLGFAQDSVSALICLTVTVFCFTLQGGLPAGALQLMAPNRLRGQLVALYMLIVVLLGTALGPTFTALLTDHVFGNDAAVGKSLAVTGAVLCPLAALIMWRGLKHIRGVIQETAAWEADNASAPRER